MKNSVPFQYRRCSGNDRESGVALIMALICLFVMSTLAVGVLYSTQSEVWTTSNYRAATQARYMAEAGAQQALDYLQTLNVANNTPIVSNAAFTTAHFSYTTGMPVMYTPTAKPVIMATGGITSTYQDTEAAIDTALSTGFDNAFLNTFSHTVTTDPYAGLVGPTSCITPSSCPHFDVAVQLLTASKSGTSWFTRWKIVSEGTLNTLGGSSTSAGKAMVQVVEIVDNVLTVPPGGSIPSYSAGVFATGTGCNSIVMSGGQYTNGYVGATQVGVANPVLSNTGGDIGTFGNVKITNGAYIIGNVSSPFYNSGTNGTYGISGGPSGLNSSTACSGNPPNFAVNEDNSGSGVGCTAQSAGSCSQKTYNIPSPPPSYGTPTMPTVAANTTAPTGSSAGIWYGLLGGGSGGGNGCSVTVAPSGGTVTGGFTSPANFGDVNMGSCAQITLQAGVYNMDSLYISNGAKIFLPATGSVVINILDQGSVGTPLNIDGGTVANNGGNPANLTFVYAGSKPINLAAGANMFGTVYAPNASITVSGNAGLYGAVVSKTATFSGSGHVIYDTSLSGTAMTVTTGSAPPAPGALHIDEFSWSAF